jgi:hypothetical protein
MSAVLVKHGESLRYYQPILPSRWQGEVDCVIGPFSSKPIAEYFAAIVVDFSHFEAVSERIFANRDAWFIEAQHCTVASACPEWRKP